MRGCKRVETIAINETNDGARLRSFIIKEKALPPTLEDRKLDRDAGRSGYGKFSEHVVHTTEPLVRGIFAAIGARGNSNDLQELVRLIKKG